MSECPVCLKTVKHLQRHRCKGAPSNTCTHCGLTFKHQQQLSRHKRMFPDGQCAVVTHDFGKENVEHLKTLIFEDVRLKKAIECDILNALDIVHFDPEHPENHTIRKRNKRDDVLEIRCSNRWIPVSYKSTVAELKLNLENKLRLGSTPESWVQMTDNNLRGCLKRESCRTISDIALMYEEDSRELKCNAEIAEKKRKLMKDFESTMLSEDRKMRKLQTIENRCRTSWYLPINM